jgi:hypothetical protein
VAFKIFVVLDGEQSQKNSANEIHALSVASAAEVNIGDKYLLQFGQVPGHGFCSFHIFVDGLDLTRRESTGLAELLEGEFG